MTKIGEKRIHTVRTRGGNTKFRAMRLDSGNFAWGTENCVQKVRILDVNYNASNNELVRTKTLVKGAVVLVDAHPFKSWYESHYGVKIGIKKGKKGDATAAAADTKASNHVMKTRAKRNANRTLDDLIDNQMASGRLYAKISSRPGQSGRADGYILEGKELEFYKKQMAKK
jgi:small subunit ribosomal protein S8e